MKNRKDLSKGSKNFGSTYVKKVDIDREFREKVMQLQTQKESIIWNRDYVGKKRRNGEDLMKEMEKIQLTNSSIIIQLYREDTIPAKTVSFDENGKIVNWLWAPSLIDARRAVNDPESLVPNPIPTISKGIVVGVSPDVTMNYLKKKKEMEALGMDISNFKILEVGDVVYTNHFMTKNMRYYIDKQEKTRDIVITPTDFTLENFDFLFKITDYEIESIVKKDCINSLVDAKYPHEELFMSMNENNFKDYFVIKEDNENMEIRGNA